MKIALTGATGNMGKQTLRELLLIPNVTVNVLVHPNDKRLRKLKRNNKKNLHRINVVIGSLSNPEVCQTLIDGVGYVINLASVIPPASDKHPQAAIECNEKGVQCLVAAIENANPQPKLIHTSTVALYGNRNEKRMWARVGDPLLVSPFDIYSLTKLRGEFCVLESNIANKTVLRQTAMLHENMLSDNMSDGLMFHTCFNAPLEWVTAEDSGLLVANIIRQDMEKELGNKFWNKVFNIGGGLVNCVTGYDVLNDGFEIIGGSVKDFFRPNFNAGRNFHGVWFYDTEKLNDLFHFQRQSTKYFWKQIEKNNGYMKLGKCVPKSWIRKLAIERLFKDDNSVRYWYNHGDEARMFAYFGGTDKYEAIGTDWNNFPLLYENKGPSGPIDYAQLKDKSTANMVDIGYDPDSDQPVTLSTLAHIADMHGGKLVSTTGEITDKLTWINSDGETFVARGTTVLAGHWHNPCYTQYCWDFDRLAKKDKIYAQVWYDSHATDEDKFYWLDENFNACYKDIR